MDSERFKQYHAFCRAMSEVDGFDGQGEGYCIAFYSFVVASLELLVNEFPPEFTQWFEAARLRARGQLSLVQRLVVFESIVQYRKEKLGLGWFWEAEFSSKEDVLTSLLFRVIDREIDGLDCEDPVEISNAVEMFAFHFIEHFGRSEELTNAFINSFSLLGPQDPTVT